MKSEGNLDREPPDCPRRDPEPLRSGLHDVEEDETAVGHQSGDDLHDQVYLSVYEVTGIPSDYHAFARISITKL